MEMVFSIIILIFSVIIHEMAHGYAAVWLGDPTPRLQGRLSLNPANHLDPVGSFLLPTLSYLLGGFIIGWAKPVVINPYNLRAGRWGEPLVAIAGPLSNILIALIFGILYQTPFFQFSPVIYGFFESIILINIVLAVFNMVPIPPLDGSKVLFALLPASALKIRYALEQYGLIFVFVFVAFGWVLIRPVIAVLFMLFTGIRF